MAITKLVILVCFLILSGILLMDFFRWEGRGDIEWHTSVPSSQDFQASMTVDNIAFDDRAESATVTLELEVEPIKKGAVINSVSYGYQVESDGKTSNLISCTNTMKECFASYEELLSPKGPHRNTATIRNTRAPIRLTEGRSRIWYPFDKFSIPIDFRGWVGSDAEGEPTLGLERLTIKDSEPNFVLRERSGQYFLVRRPFIRIVSVVFLLLSLAFLGYLTRVGEPTDLLAQSLGFFGALWGLRALLVPASVSVFPTLIDYVILTEFCLLFLMIISRVSLSKEADRTP